MTNDEIKVSVVKYSDRKYLMMRYIDPLTGKQVGRSTRTTNKRKADRLAAKWEAELQEGRYQKLANRNWDEFRERYEEEVLPGLAKNTGNLVGTSFNTVEKILNPRHLRDLTSERLSYFQSRMRADGLSEETIRAYLAHLKSALAWAVDLGWMPEVPKIQMPKRIRKSKFMKGRPLSDEEFEFMLGNVVSVVGGKAAASWQYFLKGLWWSGLRLNEGLTLSWNSPEGMQVELSGQHPILRVPAHIEKGNKDRLLPIAPEFAEFLLQTPESKREGRVFQLVGLRGNERVFHEDWVSRIVSRIGKAAQIVVDERKLKYASAHDLRRSFGSRWAPRVMPQILKELMRHESIDTTMKYYVGIEAQQTARALWTAYGHHSKS